jgi:hypothetical protein
LLRPAGFVVAAITHTGDNFKDRNFDGVYPQDDDLLAALRGKYRVGTAMTNGDVE